MSRQNQLQEMPSKLGATQAKEPPSASVKNTMPHLSGHKPRLVAKNGSNSKPPDLYLSTESREKAGAQFTVPKAPQRGLALRESLPESEREYQPPRRPLKLAPLELTRQVTESQKQKIKEAMQEANASTRMLEALGHKPVLRKAKAGAKNWLPKSSEHSSHNAPGQPPRAQKSTKGLLPAFGVKQNTGPLTRDAPIPHASSSTESHIGPPGTVVEQGRREPSVRLDASTRYQRLWRAKGIDEDQNNPNIPMPKDDRKPTVRNAVGQRTEKVLKEASQMLDRSRKPT